MKGSSFLITRYVLVILSLGIISFDRCTISSSFSANAIILKSIKVPDSRVRVLFRVIVGNFGDSMNSCFTPFLFSCGAIVYTNHLSYMSLCRHAVNTLLMSNCWSIFFFKFLLPFYVVLCQTLS